MDGELENVKDKERGGPVRADGVSGNDTLGVPWGDFGGETRDGDVVMP
jgi:hypothetical protein